MSLPEKFPSGTRFLFYDFMPIVEAPNGNLTVYDPEPREISWDAIKSEPGVLTEEAFRAKVTAKAV